MKLPLYSLALGLTLFSSTALAHTPVYGGQSATAPELVFSLGMHFGGDDLATVEYEDGADDDLEAGGGFYIGAGIEFPMIPDNLAIRTSVGYQADSIDADNGDASFDRIPWDALVLLGSSPHRFGVGLTYHTDVQYEFNDDIGRDVDAVFEDALGLVLAYEFRFAPNFSLTLKYTDIEYKENIGGGGGSPRAIDGGNGAITANLLF